MLARSAEPGSDMARNQAKQRPRRRSEEAETKSATHPPDVESLIDDLMEFADFRQRILPAIRQDLSKGLSAAQLREKYASLVQARQLTEAVTSENADTALRAGQSILDRVEGKATEKREVKHTFENMTDEELDAVLRSEISDLADMEQRFKQ